MKRISIIFLLIVISGFIFANSDNTYELRNSKYKIVFDNNLNSSLYVHKNDWQLISSALPFCYLLDKEGNELKNFSVKKIEQKNNADSPFGKSKLLEINSVLNDKNIELNLKIYFPDEFENSIICSSSIKNLNDKNVDIDGYGLANFLLNAKNFGADSSYKFWSFQGGSYEQRYDWIFPLTKDYSRNNYQGMNAPDYGGGMPVVDLWTKDQGIAFASLSKTPELISLPLKVNADNEVQFKITKEKDLELKPGEEYNLLPFAIIFHHGDYFNGLRTFSNLMQKDGFEFSKAPESAYNVEWCAWGYERNFNKEQILKSLSEVKKLGIEWVTIDDGWQNADGDWEIDKTKFPGGEKEFKALIDTIHAKGLKVRIWWVPFEAQDSSYNAKHFPGRMSEYGMRSQSKLASQHPDWFILDKNGNRVQVSWWNSYYLCPAVKGVVDHYEKFVETAINNWGIDGFKIDGQNLNAVPRCYNQLHNHLSPEDAPKSVPDFFKVIYKTAQKLKPGFIIQICPCGTNFSFYNLPYVNQLVASDPLDSWQVRLKGKTFKALLDSKIAYSGDHVELTNRVWDEASQKEKIKGKEDFVSTLAVGGVPSTKFTVPGIKQADSSLILTAEKEKIWKKWISIYQNEDLKDANYLNVYDIAFDKPETHLLKNGDNYYYTFFADKYSGKVELRGLEKGKYKIFDLNNDKELTELNSANPIIQINFNSYLMIKATKYK